MIDMNKMLISN